MQATYLDPSLLLTMLLPVAPYVFAWMAGIVMCILRWRRHPAVSLLGVAAFTTFIGVYLVGALARNWLIVQRINGTWSDPMFGIWSTVLTVLHSGVGFVGWCLLLTGYFGWRGRPGELRDDAPKTEMPASRWGE